MLQMGAIGMSTVLGKLCTRLMQDKGFTLKALAESVDVPQSSLNNWSNGTPSTDYDALCRLAETFQELFEEHAFIDALLEVRIKRLVPRGGSAK